MDKEIIQLLKSSNPDDRIEGINRLVESGHSDTAKILNALYKRETDPQVKQLLTELADQAQEADSSLFGEKKKVKTRRDPAAAKAHLENAMDAMIAFKNDEAWNSVKKAFLADPELAEDDYAIGLACEITGADPSMVVETLLSGGESTGSPEKPKRSEKAKISSGEERVGWGKALAGIGVYALLNALAVAIPVAIFGTAFAAFVAFLTDDPSIANTGGGTFAIIAGVTAIIMIVFTFIGIFISYGLIHFSATTFLNGKGYFTNLLWNMRIPLITQFVIQTVIGGIMIFLLFSSFASIDPVEFEAAFNTGDASYISGFEDNSTTIQALNGLNGLVSLGFIVWASMVIGKTYDFGAFKGCASIIISSIVMMVAVCGCYFTIFTAVMRSMDLSNF